MDIRKFFQTIPSVSSNSKQNGSNIICCNDTAQGSPAINNEGCSKQEEVMMVHKSSEEVCGRPTDLGIEAPVQPRLPQASYPQSVFGKYPRRFNPLWFNGREWLEYSCIRDAAFCFACNKFYGLGGHKIHQSEFEATWTMKGYKNWKKGIDQHAESMAHRTAMILWKEQKERELKNKCISTIVNDEQLVRNRYYVKSLIDVIFFLGVNELPLRGSDETAVLDRLKILIDEPAGLTEPSGLFVKLFQYTLQKDPQLASIYSTIPRNASYTSPKMQNEVISILANLIVEEVVKELGDAWYTLMCDATRDVNGIENISIVLRYVDASFNVQARLLCIAQINEYDAESLTDTIIQHLEQRHVRLDRMVAQCFDGAAVMSGAKGGVQYIMQQRLHRKIPYIHCFNHQLHLVVSAAMSSLKPVNAFFDICQQLFVFVRRPIIAAQYQGESLKRVLDQRWEGHLAAAMTIKTSMIDIVDLLEITENGNGDVALIASGLLKRIKTLEFQFLALCIPMLLMKLDTPNKMLQSKSASLQEAIELIHITKEVIAEMKTKDHFDSLWKSIDHNNLPLDPQALKRRRVMPTRLAEFDITGEGSLCIPSCPTLLSSSSSQYDNLFELYQHIVAFTLQELDRRFGELHSKIASAVEATNPASKNFMNATTLKPLADLIGLTLDETELVLAKKFFAKESGRATDSASIQRSSVTEAMPTVQQILSVARTISISTAACESSFSTLNRILTPQRQSMLDQRKSDLILISYEQDLASRIHQSEDLIKRFYKAGSNGKRRLQLF
jgi:Domain of unknown function (DUF4371)/hAT family C-terminal dimerisation region